MSGISQNNYIFKILDLNNVHYNWKVLLSVRSYNVLRHLSHAAVIETSLPFSECLACLSHLLLSYSMQRSTIKWLYCHKGKTEPRVHELWGFLSWEDCDVSLKITAVRNKCCRSVLCSKLIFVGIYRWNYYSTQSLFVSCEEFQNGGKSPSSSLKVQNILTSSAVSFSDLPKIGTSKASWEFKLQSPICCASVCSWLTLLLGYKGAYRESQWVNDLSRCYWGENHAVKLGLHRMLQWWHWCASGHILVLWGNVCPVYHFSKINVITLQKLIVKHTFIGKKSHFPSPSHVGIVNNWTQLLFQSRF